MVNDICAAYRCGIDILLLIWPTLSCWKSGTALALTTTVAHRRRDSTVPYEYIFAQRSSSPDLSSSSSPSRPLVLIPGFAQRIDLYQVHLPALSRDRDVLIIQPLQVDDFSSSNDVSLPVQAQNLATVLDKVYSGSTVDDEIMEVDLVGFSMGARIALAAACVWNQQDLSRYRVHKLHMSGVGWQPSPEAQLLFSAWKDLLRHDNLRGWAWNVILASYSASFLLQNKERLVAWVDNLQEAHSAISLLALLEQTHHPEWIVETMAEKIPAPCNIQLQVGDEDRLVTVESVKVLCERLPCEASYSVVPSCGHAVPLESPRKWRDDVIQFLDKV
jgi:pimeloyl-ACP methyl ester carboxylesterase